MVARKQRTPVVVDTNVLIRNLKSKNLRSANKRVVRLWLVERRLQFIVSSEVVAEYLQAFDEVGAMAPHRLDGWRELFEQDRRCTIVNLGRRFTQSRDPDDNVFLATAFVGRADYLITNDRDLLELPVEFRRTLPFEILTPRQFLEKFEGEE